MVELVLDKLTLVPKDVLDPKDSEALLPVCTEILTVSPLAAGSGVGSDGICCPHAGAASEPRARMARRRCGQFMDNPSPL